MINGMLIKNTQSIMNTQNHKMRAQGAGRKLKMGDLEDLIAAKVIKLSSRKI